MSAGERGPVITTPVVITVCHPMDVPLRRTSCCRRAGRSE